MIQEEDLLPCISLPDRFIRKTIEDLVTDQMNENLRLNENSLLSAKNRWYRYFAQYRVKNLEIIWRAKLFVSNGFTLIQHLPALNQCKQCFCQLDGSACQKNKSTFTAISYPNTQYTETQ